MLSWIIRRKSLKSETKQQPIVTSQFFLFLQSELNLFPVHSLYVLSESALLPWIRYVGLSSTGITYKSGSASSSFGGSGSSNYDSYRDRDSREDKDDYESFQKSRRGVKSEEQSYTSKKSSSRYGRFCLNPRWFTDVIHSRYIFNLEKVSFQLRMLVCFLFVLFFTHFVDSLFWRLRLRKLILNVQYGPW